MVEVVCDTSFLMHLASTRIKNIENIEIDIGRIQFVIPDIVIQELNKLSNEPNKKNIAHATLEQIKNYKIISLKGKYADEALIDFVKENGGIIGTIDKELKTKIKQIGGSILSFSNDRIVLEP